MSRNFPRNNNFKALYIYIIYIFFLLKFYYLQLDGMYVLKFRHDVLLYFELVMALCKILVLE